MKGLRVHSRDALIELPFPQLRTFPDYGLVRTRHDFDALLVQRAQKAGARLMVAFARAYGAMDDAEHAIEWGERAIVVGERLNLTEVIVRSLHTRGSALIKLNRSREGLILIRGAGELAQSHGLLDAETRWRTLSTFIAQWDDPRAGLEAGRAGQA